MKETTKRRAVWISQVVDDVGPVFVAHDRVEFVPRGTRLAVLHRYGHRYRVSVHDGFAEPVTKNPILAIREQVVVKKRLLADLRVRIAHGYGAYDFPVKIRIEVRFGRSKTLFPIVH